MTYRQITFGERYTLGLLRRRGLSPAVIARVLGRHRSTIGRELARNQTAHDGAYRPQLAEWYARGRRSRSRRNRRFTAADLARVQALLCQQWSPEQVAGYLRRHRLLQISHETIYRYIWADKQLGGQLYTHLRGARKQRRKRSGRYDSRGRLAGKRPITARPAGVETRAQLGHWEADTVLGVGRPCLLSMVERKTGYVVPGKLRARVTGEVNRRTTRLIRRQRRRVRTITADNGTEFHGYAAIEAATAARFYFATPTRRGNAEPTRTPNGLLRQYLPKGTSLAHLTQHDCDRLAAKLNRRPRKRLGYRTPEECYAP